MQICSQGVCGSQAWADGVAELSDTAASNNGLTFLDVVGHQVRPDQCNERQEVEPNRALKQTEALVDDPEEIALGGVNNADVLGLRVVAQVERVVSDAVQLVLRLGVGRGSNRNLEEVLKLRLFQAAFVLVVT